MNPLSKVFTVIETVIGSQGRGVTYSEIIRDSELPRSTVHRLLKGLVELGYLNFDPATKRYCGSMRFAALGAEVTANFTLRDHIHPYLLELHQDTEHTANFGILDDTRGIFLDKVESRDYGIKLFSEIGRPFPLYCTGLGKILLACSPSDTFERMIRQPLKAETERTITDPDDLRRELALSAERGYAVDNEEITRGIICVAAPVFDFDRKLRGAISLTFPAYLNDDRGLEPEIAAITRYAASISRSLGGSNAAVP
jgi:DNA-binding IclR family transcriptional regulator